MVTAAGIKIKAKPKAKVALHDEKLTGPEPTWTGTEEGDAFNVKLRNSLFYANYHFSTKDVKSDVLQYVNEIGVFDRNQMKRFSSAYDSKTIVSIGTAANLCRAGVRGAPLTDAHKEFIADTFKELLDNYRVKDPEPVAETATTAKAPPKPTIQDRLSEKTSELIGELEGHFDEVAENTAKSFKHYDWFVKNNVVQTQLSKYEELYNRRKAELELAQGKTDDQLKEGYRHFKAADFKRVISWIDGLMTAIEEYRGVKKAAKKARVKKAPSKEKLVSKVKYCKEDKALKLVSINPAEVLGAKEVWVYNVKTRKIGKYVANEYQTLTIKGTSIENFSESLSVAKTVRKPEETLAEFKKAGKLALRKFLSDIKAVEIKLNGRLNTDTVLLKAV